MSRAIQWVKLTNNRWPELQTVNLESIGDVAGVYVIWHSGQPGKWVRVGQGNIKQRLSPHRADASIMRFNQHGLFVSWASVPQIDRDGVEAYLAASCNPLVGERFPDRIPIEVNLPQ